MFRTNWQSGKHALAELRVPWKHSFGTRKWLHPLRLCQRGCNRFHVFHVHSRQPANEITAPTHESAETQKRVHGSMGLPNDNLVAPWYGGHKKYKKLLLGWNCYKTSCFTRVASTGNIIRVADFWKPNPKPPSKRPPPNNESAKGSLYGGGGVLPLSR
jgi:hypothetical protein